GFEGVGDVVDDTEVTEGGLFFTCGVFGGGQGPCLHLGGPRTRRVGRTGSAADTPWSRRVGAVRRIRESARRRGVPGRGRRVWYATGPGPSACRCLSTVRWPPPAGAAFCSQPRFCALAPGRRAAAERVGGSLRGPP